MGIFSTIRNAFSGKPQPEINPIDKFIYDFVARPAEFPNTNNDFYLKSYTGNNDIFTVINKITGPGSRVPIYQYDKNGEIIKNGKMIALLNKPNSYQSRIEFIEAALSFYYIFGESFTAFQTLDKSSGSLNAGVPMRLDQLPPQWIKLDIGTYFNPVTGYSFYPFGSSEAMGYPKEQVFHWKDFNPDYTSSGGHLRGMSRMKTLLKTIIGTDEGYNSLVKAFQAQGMWGIVTMLEPETKKAVELTKEQKSLLKQGFARDMKKGELTVANSSVEYTKMGLTIVELEVLRALTRLCGKITDVFDVPDQLFAGSESKTYMNYPEANKALWTNAICPSVDGFLEGLTNLLAPHFKGEEETVLKADYSTVEALQKDIGKIIIPMAQVEAFTRDEIREAAGYEMLKTPEMSEVFISAGKVPISQSLEPPDPVLTENVMKQLGLSDYRHKVRVN